MNNTFHSKRFGKLLKKTLLERPMQTLGLTGLLLVLTLILYSVIKTFGGFNPAQNLTFIWCLSGGRFLFSFFCLRIFFFQRHGLFISYFTGIRF